MAASRHRNSGPEGEAEIIFQIWEFRYRIGDACVWKLSWLFRSSTFWVSVRVHEGKSQSDHQIVQRRHTCGIWFNYRLKKTKIYCRLHHRASADVSGRWLWTYGQKTAVIDVIIKMICNEEKLRGRLESVQFCWYRASIDAAAPCDQTLFTCRVLVSGWYPVWILVS